MYKKKEFDVNLPAASVYASETKSTYNWFVDDVKSEGTTVPHALIINGSLGVDPSRI